MMPERVGPSPAPARKLAPAPAHQMQPERASVFQAAASNALARSSIIDVPDAPKRSTAPLTYAEIERQNEPLIQTKAKEMQEILLAKGIRPEDTTFLFLVDVTGHPVMVCLACGQIGHDFMPTKIRQDNPEINMLLEYFVVARAASERVGVRNGFVVYDEEVAVIREPQLKTGNPEEELQRFDAFLGRHQNKPIEDGTVMDWMAEESKRWNPSDANREVVGDAADARALEVGRKLLEGTGGRRWMMVAKGQPPTSNLRAQEMMAKAKGIRLSGVAVGANADHVASMMFQNTLAVQELHHLRDSLDGQVRAAAAQEP